MVDRPQVLNDPEVESSRHFAFKRSLMIYLLVRGNIKF